MAYSNNSYYYYYYCYFLFVLILGLNGNKNKCEGQKLVPAVYVFGDSLVDVGNNNHLKLSTAIANFPHNGVDFPGRKPTGRFSNGKNAADFIAEKLGVPTSPPYLSISKSKDKNSSFLGGVSFASGGAGIFNGSDNLRAISLTRQVEFYSVVHESLVGELGSGAAQQHLSKSIFTIVIGSNDIFGYFGSGSTNLRKTTTPQQFIAQMLLGLKAVFKQTHSLGARKYLISGIGPVGCCPSQRNQNKTEECNEEVNFWAKKYNEGLKSLLQELKSELKDMNYSYFDTYSLLLSFIQTPATYGFDEVKSACCGLGNLRAQVPCIPISVYCSNRSNHIFWDLVHPTEKASRILVDNIYEGSQEYVTPINLKQLVAV